MDMSLFVEVVNTGNELLDGRVLNTNGAWIARRCSAYGLRVRRITVVGDDLDEIASAIREGLSRRPVLLIVTGGLGPTPDDLTAKAIAKAVGRELRLDEEALGMLRRFYGQELTPAREKMAWLPEGARALENPVGAAPGIMVEHEGTRLIALPGVPAEMEAMFEAHVEPLLSELARGLIKFEARFLAFGVRESDVAEVLEEIAERSPDVYVKTHPRAEDGHYYLEIYVSIVARSPEEARKKMGSAIMALSEHVAELGGSMKPYKLEDGR